MCPSLPLKLNKKFWNSAKHNSCWLALRDRKNGQKKKHGRKRERLFKYWWQNWKWISIHIRTHKHTVFFAEGNMKNTEIFSGGSKLAGVFFGVFAVGEKREFLYERWLLFVKDGTAYQQLRRLRGRVSRLLKGWPSLESIKIAFLVWYTKFTLIIRHI